MVRNSVRLQVHKVSRIRSYATVTGVGGTQSLSSSRQISSIPSSETVERSCEINSVTSEVDGGRDLVQGLVLALQVS